MKSIAEDLKKTEEEAKEIYDAVLTNIQGLKHLMDESQEYARVHGFVEDKWGRRRHIPDMQLEPYVLTESGMANFDPFFDSKELGVVLDSDRLKAQFIQRLQEAKWRSQKEKIKDEIAQAGFKLRENTKKIEDATRQCVNSRIQGSAATQSKIAIRLIGTNERLKKLCFKMAILVHDEILAEVPFVCAREASEIFRQCMLNSSKDLRTGAACDCEYSECWYGNSYELEDLTHEKLQEVKKKVFS